MESPQSPPPLLTPACQIFSSVYVNGVLNLYFSFERTVHFLLQLQVFIYLLMFQAIYLFCAVGLRAAAVQVLI